MIMSPLKYLPSIVISLVMMFYQTIYAYATDGKLEAIVNAGKIRVCELDYPPMNFKDPTTGEWNGLMVDMIDAFADEIGVSVEHVDTNWGTVIPNLNTDRCDMSVGATYASAQRALAVLFTDQVTADASAAFVRKEDSYVDYDELNVPGKIILVQSGAANENDAKQMFPQAEVKSVLTDRVNTMLLDVAAGRADAAYTSIVGAVEFLNVNRNISLRQINDKWMNPAPVAWMIPLKEYHLQNVVNLWLKSFKNSGGSESVEKKWLSLK